MTMYGEVTCHFTKEQCEAIGQRIECLLEDTEDWQMDPAEFRAAVKFWIDILDELEVEHPWNSLYLE